MNGEHSKVESVTTDHVVSHTPGPWSVYERNPLCIESPHGNIGLVNLARASEADARLIAAAPDLLAALKEMGDWIAAGLQASDEAWPDARCLQHTEEIAARAHAAVDKAEGRS